MNIKEALEILEDYDMNYVYTQSYEEKVREAKDVICFHVSSSFIEPLNEINKEIDKIPPCLNQRTTLNVVKKIINKHF